MELIKDKYEVREKIRQKATELGIDPVHSHLKDPILEKAI